MEILPFVIAALALFLGGVAGYFAGSARGSGALKLLQTQSAQAAGELALLREKAENALRERAAAERDLVHLKERLETERRQIQETQKQFEDKFKALAESVLEEKSRKLGEQGRLEAENSRLWLSGLVNPLKENITEFRRRLETLHESEAKSLATLGAQVQNISAQSLRMSEEAQRLSTALTGDRKAMGQYGEMMLERVLEYSGLQKDVDFELQPSFPVEGGRLQPDAVVKLPGGRSLVVDAKVSLAAYVESCGQTEPAEISRLLDGHVASVRAHVEGLSRKEYHLLPGLESLELVLLFIPNEAAFLAALRHDRELHGRAFEKKILLVSPTTLLAVLKVVYDAWRHERQGRNALEIARLAGELHDKFVAVVEDLKNVHDKIDAAQASLGNAVSRLHTGRGNIVRQIGRIKELGAKASKSLPTDEVQAALEEDPSSPPP